VTACAPIWTLLKNNARVAAQVAKAMAAHAGSDFRVASKEI
jgi:hypothetical protein